MGTQTNKGATLLERFAEAVLQLEPVTGSKLHNLLCEYYEANLEAEREAQRRRFLYWGIGD